MIFFVTNRCNLACGHCFYWARIQDKGARDLALSEIEEFTKSCGRLHDVLISGGEPYLREDLPEICALFYRNSKVRKIAIPTNGFLPEKICAMTKKILDACPGVRLEVSVSIDGLEDVHDATRGVRGSFKRASETCDLIVDLKKNYRNLSCYVSTTLHNLNLPQVATLKEFMRQRFKGIDSHRFGFLRGSWKDGNIFLPEGKLRELAALITSCGKDSAEFHLENLFLGAKLATLREKRQVFRCMAGTLMGVLENNGDVRLCELRDPVGNIREGSLSSVWRSEAANRQRGSIRQGKCHCTHECFIAPSILYNCENLARGLLLYLKMRNRRERPQRLGNASS